MSTLQLALIASSQKCRSLTVQEFESANFGRVPLTPEQSTILSFMNSQIVELCRELPTPLRGSALITIQRHFTGFQLSNLVNFFTKFYTPSWSIVHWMQQNQPTLRQHELDAAFSAQAMAYFLHMLDDHLADGQIPTSHLLLQLRTQAWMKFTQGINVVAQEVAGGEALVQVLFDRYFSGIHSPPQVKGLDGYCELFRKQLSTTLIVPMLVARQTGCNVMTIEKTYEAFCMAWRLIDDLRDCSSDAFAGETSAVYHLLSPEWQMLWCSCRGKDTTAPEWKMLQRHLEETGILSTLVSHILGWLSESQSTAESIGLVHYATELRQLAYPLVELSICQF